MNGHNLTADELHFHQISNGAEISFPDTTLDALFRAQAIKTPDALALVFGHTGLSYQDLDEASTQLAHFIRAHYIQKKGDFKPDTPIALFLNRSLEMMIGILGILKAGGAYVPIDPKYPSERIQYILEDTQTDLVLTQRGLETLLKSEKKQTVVYLEEEPYAQENKTPLPSLHTPHHLAYILYTSGTTGKPKGVAIPHRGVVNRIDWMQRAYPLDAKDVVLQKTPYCFDVSVWELLWAHQVGATLVMAEPDGHQDPLYLHALIEAQRVTTLHFVPSMLTVFTQALADAKQQVPESLRYVFCSGEALAKGQVDAFYELATHAVEVHNLYGPTEASIDVTYFPCTRNIEKVYIGNPIQNTQIYILDANMHPMPIGEAGELYIGGVGLAREYWNKPELTKERFVVNPFFQNQAHTSPVLYKTGDLARWTTDGYIDYLGRNDFQVKIRGFRIELGEIEHVLTQYTGIQQSIVLAQEQHTSTGKNSYLVAYYTADHAIDETALNDFLQNHLPEYMLPTAFIALDSFPLTSNGKLDRSLLPKHDFAKIGAATKPRTSMEGKIASIWAKALDIPEVGITDHFLSLGGHSLIAARILSMIKNTLHKTVSFADFYRSGTIEQLAKLLEQQDTSPVRVKPANSLNDSKKLPLADFQLMLWLSHIFEPKAKKMNILTRKRLKGHLDIDRLYQAFEYTFKKHETLYYRISKLIPTQKFHTMLPFSLERIEHLEQIENPESILISSLNELLELYPWPKNSPFVIARLFYLKDKESEIQLCMPHLIADERSMEILCEELSTGYLLDNESNTEEQVQPLISFKDYLHEEQLTTNEETESKIAFWEHYLHDARLLVFPKEHIVSSMKHAKFPYSSYIEIPEEAIQKLKSFAAAQRVTISDAISAVLSKALYEHQDEHQKAVQKPILINLIKSTRETIEYDKTIGCFVRVDPMKVSIHQHSDLKILSEQIHQDMLNTAENQRFSSLLKFACFMNCYTKKSWVKAAIARVMMPFYVKLIKLFKIRYESHKMFQLCWRLASFKRRDLFLVNLNLWNNFVNESADSILFGMPTIPCAMPQYELLDMDFILDVCFIRENASKKPYMVISCNLTPEFKASLAKRTIELMMTEMA